MSVIDTELDILKKNIKELENLSNNFQDVVTCKLCTYNNKSTGNIATSEKCELCLVKLDSYLINRLEIKRLKAIINYFILDDSYKNFIIMGDDFYKPEFIKNRNLSDPCVIIMRHGIREDSQIGVKSVVDESLNFYDKAERPYDPPLLDYDIPKLRANELSRKYNITKIVSSPFRRCLQTAGIIAKVLGIPKVNINPLFGEKCTELRRYTKKFDTKIDIINKAIDLPTKFSNNISVEGIIRIYNNGCTPHKTYAYGDNDLSLKQLINDELKSFERVSNECLLIITHGDNVATPKHFLPNTNKFFQNSVECGYISLKLNISSNTVDECIEVNGGLRTME